MKIEDVDPDRWFYTTTDPTVLLHGRPAPASTVLYYKHCDGDSAMFDEVNRIIKLFVDEAIRLHDEKKS